MQKTYKNGELTNMAESLKPLLKLNNMAGYAAAVNMRKITTALTEFYQVRDRLIEKYGEDGSIKVSSENFPKFAEELQPYLYVEQDLDLLTANPVDVAGKLSGLEIFEADWMLEE